MKSTPGDLRPFLENWEKAGALLDFQLFGKGATIRASGRILELTPTTLTLWSEGGNVQAVVDLTVLEAPTFGTTDYADSALIDAFTGDSGNRNVWLFSTGEVGFLIAGP